MKTAVKVVTVTTGYAATLYAVLLYVYAPNVFWFYLSRICGGVAHSFGRASLAAEHAYWEATERIKQ